MKTHQLLLIEDDPADRLLVKRTLTQNGFEVVEAETLRRGLELLDASHFDAMVLDLTLPDSELQETFDTIGIFSKRLPIVVLTQYSDEELAVQAVSRGAQDFLFKDLKSLSGVLPRSLRYAIARYDLEKARRESEVQFKMVAEHAPSIIFSVRLSTPPILTYINGRLRETTGYPPEDFIGKPLKDVVERIVVPEDQSRVYALFAGELIAVNNVRIMAREGDDIRWLDVRAGLAQNGDEPLLIGIARDTTEERRAQALLEETQARLLQSQKLEAVGRLAGGVAHDFNNLLTAIMNFGSFALRGLHKEDPAHQDVQQILQAAERAAELTSQLLAFSRKKVISPQVVDMNHLLRNLERMVHRLMEEDVEITLFLEPELWTVCVDPGSFEQVVINLLVNARDAMPTGGRLTLETANIVRKSSFTMSDGDVMPPGRYVLLAVSDTGTGMNDETRARIFEPFFTTKTDRGGTGLGLATCYGIIRQANGFVWVYSEEHEGTTFKIYIPVFEEDQDTAPKPVPSKQDETTRYTGNEHILVVEDDDMVRTLVERALTQQGYRITTAANGGEALLLCEKHSDTYVLLLTDVVMPILGGRELAERIQAILPHIQVLYMSGYTPNAIVHRGVLDEGTRLLHKPFALEELYKAVWEALHATDNDT